MTEPRLLFCAPRSGGGKTTLVCALLQALKNRGAAPAAFKCGPDYIDPMFHSEIIGTPSRNLDLFFLGEEKTRYLLKENSCEAGVSVIEGVMGYYDGIAMSSRASAYELAKCTQSPAVLVLDGRGCALSLAAQIKGFARFRDDSGIKGVVLSRISPMMYPRLRETIEAECGIRVYGFLPECPEAALESRHLGLVTAAEVAGLREKMAALADLCEKYVDIDGLLELASTAPVLDAEEPQLPAKLKAPVTIAVARDRAFCFYYADSLRLLERLGARLKWFSPLEDEALPEDACGMYLGGGYPELYAEKLGNNEKMRRSIGNAIRGGMPTVAECGGFLYLHGSLEDKSGKAHPMAGVIPERAYKTDRLGRFGYVTLTAQNSGLLFEAGEEMPAHEFHYWDSTGPGADFNAKKPMSDRHWACAYQTESLWAGFPHLHFWSSPEAAKRFINACAEYGRKQNGAE
ncbi:MAG: cobyrinate a,c-diamide synthase [Candidatus Heteroscillospira sp.]|jgi:cobyrinic acid a,c-diamide synthase